MENKEMLIQKCEDKLIRTIFGNSDTNKENTTERITFPVPVYKKLKKLAAKQKKTVEKVAIDSLNKFLKEENTYDLEAEMKKLVVKPFVIGKKNIEFAWDSRVNKVQKIETTTSEKPFSIYFTEESANQFYNSVRLSGILKEEFFTAYKNIFGGK